MGIFDIFTGKAPEQTDATNQTEKSPVDLPQEFIDKAPEALNQSLLPVLPLTKEMLPPVLWGYIEDQAYRMDNSPPDFIAVSIITILASVAGSRVAVQPKAKDTGWTEVLTIWAAIVSDPSKKKSPFINAATSLYTPIQAEHDAIFQEEMKLYEHQENIKEMKQSHFQKEYKKSLSKGDDFCSSIVLDDDNTRPKHRQLVINSATREALAIRLSHNPHGALQVFDEMTGWLTDLSLEKNAITRGFYLSAFSASKAPYIEERITRDPVKVNRLVLSLFGAIQPSMIIPFLKKRASGELNDGMFERIQLMVYPDSTAAMSDIAPNNEAKKEIFEVIKRISDLPSGGDDPIIYKFCPPAQKLYKEHYQKIIDKTNEASDHGDNHACAHLGKQNTLLAKLSLIFQLVIDEKDTTISSEALDYAIKWLEYLSSHNKRILALTSNSLESCKSLVGHLDSLPTPFTASSFKSKGWKHLKTANDRASALQECVLKGYLYEERIKPTTGRPTVKYHKHPSLS